MKFSRRAIEVATVVLFLAVRPSGADGRNRETAVLAATVRQQIEEHLDADARARGAVICVGINSGDALQSPSREFMDGLGDKKTLRAFDECDPEPEGAVESKTRRPAVIVIVGPIDWRAQDEAWVTVTYFRSWIRSAVRKYRVVLARNGWVSLGPIIIGIP